MRRDDGQGDTLGIEFIAPDVQAFGDSQQADFVGLDGATDGDFGDGPRVSWRVTAVAGALVVGLIAVGVVAAAPWSGDTATAPTTEPAATPSTRATTLVTPPGAALAGEPGYVLDEPGWVFRFGWSQPPGPAVEAERTDQLDIFTEPGSEAPQRWVVVRTTSEMGRLRLGATRVDLGGRTASVGRDVDGATNVFLAAEVLEGAAPSAEPQQIEVRASSTIAFDQVLALATSIASGGETESGLVYGSAGVAPSALDDLVLAWTGRVVPADFYALGAFASSVAYQRGDDPTFLYAGRTTVDRSLLPFLGLVLPGIAGPDGTPLAGVYEVGGSPVAIAAPDGGDDVAVLTGVGSVSASDLATLVTSLRLADVAEWDAMLSAASSWNGGTDAEPLSQAGTLLADDVIVPWTATIATTGLYVETATEYWWTPFRLHDGIEVRRFSDPHLSVLLVTSYWPTTARRATVTVDGSDPVELTLEQIGDEPVWAATLPFTAFGEVVVDLFDAAGASLGQVRA